MGVWKVSPFFRGILESGESLDSVGRAVFKTGRRRGCTRDGSVWTADIIGRTVSTKI